jgi:hypothetical protein
MEAHIHIQLHGLGGGLNGVAYCSANTNTVYLNYLSLPSGHILTEACYPNTNTLTYTINKVEASDAGAYSLEIWTELHPPTNNTSIVDTTPVSRQVSPAILTQPSNTICISGSSTTMGIIAGPNTATFQWFNAATQASITSASASPSFTPTTSNSGEAVYCKISSIYGEVISSSALLTVVVPPTITAQPTNAAVEVGNMSEFSVAAVGSQPMYYQWYKNGISISGANLNYLIFPSVTDTNAGTYEVVITNAFGNTNSAIVRLFVGTPIAITSQPTNLIVSSGQEASFGVSITGSQPISYQWFTPWTPEDYGVTELTTNAVLNVFYQDLGTSHLFVAGGYDTVPIYYVTVSNPFGSITSSNALLSIPPNLNIGNTSGNGVMIQFSTGTAGFTYAIQEATNLSLPLVWETVFTNAADSNGFWSFTDTNAQLCPAKMYRVTAP